MKTIAALGEFDLIRTFLSDGAPVPGSGVVVGPGDDAAVITVPRTQQLVVTTDTLVEGIHFDTDADPYLLGRKALAVNLSDIAAMLAEPHWYLLSLSLPPVTTVAWTGELGRGLRECAADHAVSLVGGNMTGARGGAVISITLMGLAGKDRAVTRAGAHPGDLLMVSGSIGDAALGLAQAKGSLTVADSEDRIHFDHRLHNPEPRVALGVALRDTALARAVIDISDGLVADLEHLCRASGVGAELHADQVPLSPAARHQLEIHGPGLLPRLLGGGEDYELLFTVAPGAAQAVAGLATACGVALTEIGVITRGPGVKVDLRGEPLAIERGGWRHF